MAWYTEWFDSDYVDVYAHRNGEEAEAFVRTLTEVVPLKPEQNILDLCCGGGRHSIALAQRGFNVTGIDLSEQLIGCARKAASEKGVSVRFIRRDMRDIPFVGCFDGVVNMFTSFGYFGADEENERVVEGVSRALRHGGWFVLDFMNRDYVLNHLTLCDEMKRGAVTIRQRRSFNAADNRIEKKISVIKNGAEREYYESVRLYSRHDIERLFADHDLIPWYIFGDYDGGRYDSGSPRMIFFAGKQ